ncbi:MULTISPECIES: Cof-type HAD-IIB family hydrolase [unclassified Leeuwenhoekiella]|uniref:Cof-type HAD-IIB family hydrolase n=1 Tax=unclassified Leeuwenhoekiella TaxID=2615029 RepID=UPI0025BB84CC|nr:MULTISPECIES: Cof-type HAD-IIB family hydrolase [unclassified Leeuwenhoekiella]|tara:strand:+ start:27715 stop:28536 length:822 start_codon:yes stop_codon:yes gene_type:complete
MNSNIKLICSDIDGTLLNADRDIAPETASAFNRLPKDFPVILASSRMPSAMYYLQEKIGCFGSPLICYNGALVLDEKGNALQSHTISLDLLNSIIDHHQNYDYNISTHCTDTWRTEKMDYWTMREIRSTRMQPVYVPLKDLIPSLKAVKEEPHKIMCMGSPKALDNLITLLEEKHPGEAHLYRSKDSYVEISAKNIDKSTALYDLIKSKYNLELINVMAFGDNFNDTQLIKRAGLGVAMANAAQEVKDVADFVSEYTNKQHAVAKAIEKFLIS